MADSPFVWHEVNSRDAAGSGAFYASLFGWETQAYDMGEAGTYTMFTAGGPPIGGIMDLNRPEFEGVPAHWSTYIGVDDVDASVAKAEGLGATVLAPAFDVPTVGRMSLLKDPQGATFWVYKSEQQ